MNVGVNCFGLRKPFYNDFDGALTKLREKGVSSLEVCVGFSPEADVEKKAPTGENFDHKEAEAAIWGYKDAAEKIACVRREGFSVFSVHIMYFVDKPEDLLDIIPHMKELAEKNQIKYFVFSPMQTYDGMAAFVPVFNKICDEIESSGAKLLLHNHELECQLVGDKTGLEIILEQCPKLGVQLDVGWAKFAGQDSIKLMDKVSAQLELIHLKDIREDASPETRDTCFTAIGEGSIPLEQIIKKGFELGLGEDDFIIDQDNSDGDMLEDVGRGVKNIKRAAGQET